jgi:hypothetical protein
VNRPRGPGAARDLAQELLEELDHGVAADGVCLDVQKQSPVRVMALMAERWSRVSGTRSVGVWPLGAYVRTTPGSK